MSYNKDRNRIHKYIIFRGLAMKDLKHGKNVWRACRHKIRYATYEYAIKKALKYTEEYMKAQYVYWCPFCHGYHITGTPQRNEKERRIQEIAINKILQKGNNGQTNTGSTSLRDVLA